MSDIFFGILAIVVGLMFCFRGYLTMRIVIPFWGLFAGFALGAGLVAEFSDNRFLGTIAGWLVGAAVGLVFGALAYLYFEVSVMIGMTAIGFLLGSSVMVAFNVTWTWLIILVGVVVGVLLGIVAIASDLPMVLLTVLTAFAGSSAVVGGVMLVVGRMNTSDFDQASVVSRIQDSTGWWILYVVLALVGVGVQLQALGSLTQSLRAEWEADRGRSSIG